MALKVCAGRVVDLAIKKLLVSTPAQPPIHFPPYPCIHETSCDPIWWVDRYPPPTNVHPTTVHIWLLAGWADTLPPSPTLTSILPLYTSDSLWANKLEGQLSPPERPPYPCTHLTPCEQICLMDRYPPLPHPQLPHHPVHIRLLVNKSAVR